MTLKTPESLYDRIRREWAERFQGIDVIKKGKKKDVASATSLVKSSSHPNAPENAMGWALSKRAGKARFSQNVRDYLTAKFDLGEVTGRKCFPNDVESDMRNARDENNGKRFTRDEWLTSAQIKSFFSRLAASRKKNGNKNIPVSEEEDEELLPVTDALEDEELIDDIVHEMGIRHPLIYDVFNLCEYYERGRITSFNVKMLKSMCEHFEITYKSSDRKPTLVCKIEEMILECSCNK